MTASRWRRLNRLPLNADTEQKARQRLAGIEDSKEIDQLLRQDVFPEAVREEARSRRDALREVETQQKADAAELLAQINSYRRQAADHRKKGEKKEAVAAYRAAISRYEATPPVYRELIHTPKNRDQVAEWRNIVNKFEADITKALQLAVQFQQ